MQFPKKLLTVLVSGIWKSCGLVYDEGCIESCGQHSWLGFKSFHPALAALTTISNPSSLVSCQLSSAGTLTLGEAGGELEGNSENWDWAGRLDWETQWTWSKKEKCEEKCYFRWNPLLKEELNDFFYIVEQVGGKANWPKRNYVRGSSNNLWVWSMVEELLGWMFILFTSTNKVWSDANWLLQSVVHLRLYVFFALHNSFPFDLYERKGFIRKDKEIF